MCKCKGLVPNILILNTVQRIVNTQTHNSNNVFVPENSIVINKTHRKHKCIKI